MTSTEMITAAGLRATPTRVAVLEHLRSHAIAQRHYDLIKAYPRTPREMLWSALRSLMKVGLVRRFPGLGVDESGQPRWYYTPITPTATSSPESESTP